MRILRLLLSISLTGAIGSLYMRKQQGAERKVKEMQECQTKLHHHLERIPPESLA
jgi:hypothetical protein